MFLCGKQRKRPGVRRTWISKRYVDMYTNAYIINDIMGVLVENVVKLFVNDTHICEVNALQLMKYQMEKHNWTYEQWTEYYQIYRNNLNSIGLV